MNVLQRGLSYLKDTITAVDGPDIMNKALATAIRKRLMQKVVGDEVGIVSATLVNSVSDILDDFDFDHVIIQEGFHSKNGEIFAAMVRILAVKNAQARRVTLHVSGDPEQMGNRPHDIRDDCFATSTNHNIIDRLMSLGYPSVTNKVTGQFSSLPISSRRSGIAVMSLPLLIS